MVSPRTCSRASGSCTAHRAKVNGFLFEDKPARTFERIAALADRDVLVLRPHPNPGSCIVGGVLLLRP
jgi:hypothetical protein